DLLDQNRGKPIKVADKLWIQELDIQEEINKNWGDVHKYLSLLLNTTGLDEILAEELAILPGMEEVSLLLYINRYVREESFDVIILDCAPTGESIRFISIPTALEWYITKLLKLERTIAKYMRPVAKHVTDIPIPGDDYFAAIEYLFNRLRGVDQILIDPKVTSVRLVTNPEKIVLRETQRAFMYFCLYKMNIDGIIMNRVLPTDVKDSYFSDWRRAQKNYIAKAEEYFNPIPIFPVNLFKGEILGYRSLKSLADQIYGHRNPLERFFKGKPYNLVKADGEYRMRMTLPFVSRKEVELNKLYDELVVRVGSFKRHILLPRQVAAAKSVKATLEGDDLLIQFKGVRDEQKKD
ncbi:MAG: TRC40/GET3/ArsA family transport-energizing ATPase, partial [Deltaproteobacteria bacterium]|nr:TRC40/GET3/ArsA family transport-energizing ATPase [Deltaproteobacteria bacterium]